MATNLGPATIPFIACVSLLLGMVLQILSFASPFWASDDYDDFGLWRHRECQTEDDQKCDTYVKGSDVGRWLNAVRGLECIAIILWSIPLVVIPVYVYVAMGLRYTCVMGTLTAFSLVATICNIIGVVIFVLEIEDEDWDYGWCVVVCFVAGALGIVSTLILLFATCIRPKFELQRYFLSGFYVDPDRNRMYVVENIEPTKQPPVDPGQVNPALVTE